MVEEHASGHRIHELFPIRRFMKAETYGPPSHIAVAAAVRIFPFRLTRYAVIIICFAGHRVSRLLPLPIRTRGVDRQRPSRILLDRPGSRPHPRALLCGGIVPIILPDEKVAYVRQNARQICACNQGLFTQGGQKIKSEDQQRTLPVAASVCSTHPAATAGPPPTPAEEDERGFLTKGDSQVLSPEVLSYQ